MSKVAILGAGFTGLTAALRLLQQGHEVTIIEKETIAGGLAGGFKLDDWDWNLEQAYHHWFTNDQAALNLARELGHNVLTVRPKTNVLVGKDILPLDSATSLLAFPHLPVFDRLRTGIALSYLKYLANPKFFQNKKAMPWIKKFMGRNSTDLIWDPLMSGKFGEYKNDVALTWFWARIKKRTPSLAYPEGGFQNFANRISDEINRLGGKILLNTEVINIQEGTDNRPVILVSEARHHEVGSTLGVHPESKKDGFATSNDENETHTFDKIINTLPTPIFTKITMGLPEDYVKQINSIPHLSALNLILFLKKPFMGTTYWLNVTDKSFPFLVLAEHTNFMDPARYGNQHILYIGNYLPPDHPYLMMSATELLKIFDPYLKKINPSYQLQTTNYQLFSAPFAQPVVTTDYKKLIPEFKSPLPNVYIANMDMVYPWDRGTNYAIELGEKVVDLIHKDP